MNELDNYTPEVIDGYGKVLVELEKCPLCGKYMVDAKGAKYGLFPKYININIDKQMERAGWVLRSCTKVDDKNICSECTEAGKADFLCTLCKQRKPTDKIKEEIGDPTEYICTDCYETMPAKEWDEKICKIREIHRYDFE